MTTRRLWAITGPGLAVALALVAAFGRGAFLGWAAQHPDREPLEDFGRVLTFPQWQPLSWPEVAQPIALFIIPIGAYLITLTLLMYLGCKALDPRGGGIGVLMVGWLATALAAGFAGATRGLVAYEVHAGPNWMASYFPDQLWAGGRTGAIVVAEAARGANYGLLCGWAVGLAALVPYLLTRPATVVEPAEPRRAGMVVQAGLLAALGVMLVFGNPVFASIADKVGPNGRYLAGKLSFPYWRYQPEWLHGNPGADAHDLQQLLAWFVGGVTYLAALAALLYVGARALDSRRGALGALFCGWLAAAVAAGLAGLLIGVVTYAYGLPLPPDLPSVRESRAALDIVTGGMDAHLFDETMAGFEYGFFYGWLVGLAALAGYRWSHRIREETPAPEPAPTLTPHPSETG